MSSPCTGRRSAGGACPTGPTSIWSHWSRVEAGQEVPGGVRFVLLKDLGQPVAGMEVRA